MSAEATETLSGSAEKPTTVQTETDLSLLYRVLRAVIKPLRPRLVKPPGKKKAPPAGSPRLLNRPRAKGQVQIRERLQDHSDVYLYDFVPDAPRNIAIRPPSTVLYFCGGGFQSPPAREHWSLVGKLANSCMLEHHFVLVSYGLAPASPAGASLQQLHEMLLPLLAEAAKKGERMTLMGDSAGGNVAASLAMWWAEYAVTLGDYKLRNVIQNIVLISPAVDLRNCNPAMKDIDPLDPLLGEQYTGAVAEAWLKTPEDRPDLALEADDPNVSPLLHEPIAFQRLADLGIRVYGVYGTNDVLAPDAELFRHKCEENGVKGRWLVWIGQMHCFVLAGTYGMREGRKAIDWLVEVLKEVDDDPPSYSRRG
ncbi:hypothetical protein LQW54_000460 [Pestalotiopsis sp. IQ-011]